MCASDKRIYLLHFTPSRKSFSILGKKSHCVPGVLWSLLGCIRMGLGPGNFLSNGWSLHSLCWVYHLVWTSSTVSDLICAPLFCFSVCITWDLANSTTLFLVRKERGPLQQEGGGCRPSPHWPGPTSHEGLKATLDADFAIFFFVSCMWGKRSSIQCRWESYLTFHGDLETMVDIWGLFAILQPVSLSEVVTGVMCSTGEQTPNVFQALHKWGSGEVWK